MAQPSHRTLNHPKSVTLSSTLARLLKSVREFRPFADTWVYRVLRHAQDSIRTTTVSMHPGDLPPGTVRSILKQAMLSRQEFLNLL